MFYIQKPEKTDVVILCGGMGTRLRPMVSDRPKPMAVFEGVPFLTLLIFYAASFGFRRFILCAGYKGEMIRDHYRKHPLKNFEIQCVLEKESLGTGGAIRHARSWIQSNPFLVLNGDSFARFDLKEFLSFHFHQRSQISMVLTKGAGGRNTGKVQVDRAGRVVRFLEKHDQSRGYCENTGMYLLDKDVFSWMGDRKKFSIENDFFPSILQKRCFGFVRNIRLTDIGTPEDYSRAQQLFKRGLT
jgi:NDP-sugar pyrophosphorylase family protein